MSVSTDRDNAREMYNGFAEGYGKMVDEDAAKPDVVEPTYRSLRGFCALLSKTMAENSGSPSPENAVFADIGCGPGQNLAFVIREKLLQSVNAKWSFVGTDLSESMVKLAQKRLNDEFSGNAEIRVSTATDDMLVMSQFKDESVNGMMNCCTIQHFEPEGVSAVLTAAGRVLKPGGMFLLQFWCQDDSPDEPQPMPNTPPTAKFLAYHLNHIAKMAASKAFKVVADSGALSYEFPDEEDPTKTSKQFYRFATLQKTAAAVAGSDADTPAKGGAADAAGNTEAPPSAEKNAAAGTAEGEQSS